MNEVTRISGVRGFVDGNGVAQLNAEDIARGWGFTRTKDGSEYVMWDRVNRYLQEFGFSAQVRKDDFIPENMAYRLGFKASNEAAQVFQAKLADEILPAIRKHGAYLTNDTIEKVLTDPDTIINIEHNNERVLTTEQLAQVYECETKRISENFNRNADRFEEGKHYFKLEGDVLREFKRESANCGIATNVK